MARGNVIEAKMRWVSYLLFQGRDRVSADVHLQLEDEVLAHQTLWDPV